jgi:MazG family protein
VHRDHRDDGHRDGGDDPARGDDEQHRHRDDVDGQVTSGLAEALLELQALTETLRRECPWDREQTARTIVPHTVEEAYEVAEAAMGGDDAKLLDELGDLLFQVLFLALTLQEKDHGNLEAVVRGVHAKLVRRHPHVFGGEAADSAGEVRLRWERIKREQEEREGVFHDVPENLPALLHARKVQRRARAVGFEYPDLSGAVADLDDEISELKAELGGEPAPETEPDPRHVAELGDVLFAAVNVARRLNVDPELALRAATDRFRMRVERAEQLAAEAGKTWTELPLAEQDRYFDEAKEESRK